MPRSPTVPTLDGLARMPLGYAAFQNRVSASYDAYYVAGMVNGTALVTGAPTTGVIFALPFVSPLGGTLDRIIFRVTTGAGSSVARVGIYSNLPHNQALYPNALLLDGGEKTTTANNTTHSSTISLRIEPGELYWFAYLCGTAAPTIRCLAIAGCWAMMGLNANLATTPQIGWSVSQTYGALPATFPVDYTAFITAVPVPAIGVRFSA